MDTLKLLSIVISVMSVSFFRGLYSIQPPGYIGCYEDQLGENIVDALGYQNLGHDATGTTCINDCRSQKFRYAGIKVLSGNVLCYCGNEILSKTPAKCKKRCRGNKDEYCGEARKIILYDTWHQDEKGDDELTAVYISIPLTIAVAGCIIAAIYFILRRRRRRTKLLLSGTDRESSQHGISLTTGLGVANNAYSEDQASAVPSEQTYTYVQQGINSQYAEIGLDGIRTGGNTLPIRSPLKTNNVPDTYTDQYIEIPSNGLQTPSTKCTTSNMGRAFQKANEQQYADVYQYSNEHRSRNKHLNTDEHQYNHLKKQFSSDAGNESGYSHIALSKPVQNFEMASSTYSHILNKEQSAASEYDGDNTYNTLQNMPHSNTADKKKYVFDEETEYDHAIAGGENPNMNVKDEYSHIKAFAPEN